VEEDEVVVVADEAEEVAVVEDEVAAVGA